MMKAEQIPEAVVYEVFKRCEWDTEREAAEAIAAAINAWPGAFQTTTQINRDVTAVLILPLTQEKLE